MGCHTWCYAHIPEKETEWEDEFIETVKSSTEWMLDHLKHHMFKKDFEEYRDEEIESNLRWLEYFHEAETKGDISEYLKYFDNSEEKLYKYVKSLHSDPQEYTWEKLRDEWIEREEKILEKFLYIDNKISFIKQMKEEGHSSSKYGLFYIIDDKIYRETSHYRGPKYGENYVFEKQFGDMFRISNYSAPKCRSLEETLKVCETEGVDWEKRYEHCKSVKINDKEKLIEFWQTYPDALITFG